MSYSMSGDSTPAGARVTVGLSLLLRDLIHERTGIFFEDSRVDHLLSKLQPLADRRGCNSLLEYYYVLKDREHGEWDLAWEALAVQETYFWREMAQVNVLAKKIVPEWFRQTSHPFRIWSAACATGEEPFTIAIALAEAGINSNVEIHGSDASPGGLRKAMKGIYRENSFRALPPPLRTKYFTPVEGGWKLSDGIMNRVTFSRANLLELADVSHLARAHAIFCRNAFIYFSRHSIRQAVAMMATKMSPGSHLFVGASESLLRLTTDFELTEIGDALAYVRV